MSAVGAFEGLATIAQWKAAPFDPPLGPNRCYMQSRVYEVTGRTCVAKPPVASRRILVTDVHRHEYTLPRINSLFPIAERYHHSPGG